ncbi:Pyridoxamine 5'-phosphate oxidase [Promicromonospora umidemergens]|uniref:Pyridoxamine 5'-phosphate oxidase N-terminal domain-containing protein n=1 Tax=Promicromonospora umidemergens TaxID=629679 RepID=A0ABP8YBI2_9MICO|nr:pyridoxamine 5'-phosphate oxidase family protein [Promicromonospora umidemergens]MCP2285273.1 Pyridoxamine 5'-phosphate oxidase [Promicromonospora umidemergens]
MEPRDIARRVIDDNHFMVLGTAQPDGTPRVSPVFYRHAGYRDFYWISSPRAQHSRNVAAQARVELVIFSSQVDPGPDVAAVYVGATASQVPDTELAEAVAAAFSSSSNGVRAYGVEELSGTAELRLYRAAAQSVEIHVRGSDPERGTGIDRRLPAEMSPPR